ncbi:CDP-2,3-bis-(O-geranylgeranyl)-sn-glycerol synthase [Methanofollis sp. W23]|uniref:CDP-2,3-bis-(O-geranylgeranyl)-sn-glycerol synthase n=1 Tax=Methanofollis sp. W23 TaxID=2817849 RepID=UPI001FD8BDAB|nr:CDP-2,3-bis-(O-geranylgeranyl)-sn-glycerol synthase [Methanofollis sp. W23]
MVPAYVPNSAAAALGGGTPVDLGKNWRDGRRILGDGKTYRGFILGVAAGIAVGVLQIVLREHFGWSLLPEHTLVTVTLLATGALLGDMAESFIKRRLGKESGEEWPLADQYDLVVGAFVLLILFQYAWVVRYVDLLVFFWILILTPLLHRAANIIGYLIGVKEVPW